jgi:hypothetical protein
MKKKVVWLTLLALVGISYIIGRSESGTKVVHADEAARWTKTEIPLTVYRVGSRLASAQGFWQSTSTSKDKQLLSPVVVKINCTNYDKTCRESDATLFFGSILEADWLEYDITSWTEDGIVADDTDEGNCGIGHRLSLDFNSNSVTVTDYPKKVTTNKDCQPFQDANSYGLHGGQLMLYPPAKWDALAKPIGGK